MITDPQNSYTDLVNGKIQKLLFQRDDCLAALSTGSWQGVPLDSDDRYSFEWLAEAARIQLGEWVL